MADTPSQPPGWPYGETPEPPAAPTEPPAAPPGTPSFEPPPTQIPAAPMPPPAAPPAGYPPPATPTPASYPPPSGYEPPPPPASYPPAPGQPYAAPNQYAPPGQPYAAPGQPPPGWGQPPPKKSHRTLWITLAAIFGVLALGVGSCTVWFVGTVKAPVDESNRFLAAIDAADYTTAAAMTDPGCNRGLTAAELDELFAGSDIDYNLNNSSVTNNGATVSGSLSVQGRSFSTIELSLRKQGDWRVCGFRVN